MQNPCATLKKFGLNDPEIAVYLAMLGGRVTPTEIIQSTGERRATVYYSIASLEHRGLISKTGSTNGKRYAVEPPERLQELARDRVAQAEKISEEIEALIPLLTVSKSDEHKPLIAFYEGVAAIKNVAMDALYCRSGKIDVIAPQNNFFQQVGREFAGRFITERMDRGIISRNLWEDETDSALFKKYYEGNSDVRILPTIMRGKFNTTFFIFDDKVLQISSLKNAYAILITSKEYNDSMRAIFDGLFECSKPHSRKKS